MQELVSLFEGDDSDFVYSVWDEAGADKKLLCASHDPITVCKFILNSPILPIDQKARAQVILAAHVAQVREEGVCRQHRMN